MPIPLEPRLRYEYDDAPIDRIRYLRQQAYISHLRRPHVSYIVGAVNGLELALAALEGRAADCCLPHPPAEPAPPGFVTPDVYPPEPPDDE